MLTELYIEALMVDEDLADKIWELWNAGVITNSVAALAWHILATQVIDIAGAEQCKRNPEKTCVIQAKNQ